MGRSYWQPIIFGALLLVCGIGGSCDDKEQCETGAVRKCDCSYGYGEQVCASRRWFPCQCEDVEEIEDTRTANNDVESVELYECSSDNHCDDGIDCTYDRCVAGSCSSTPTSELCPQGETCDLEWGGCRLDCEPCGNSCCGEGYKCCNDVCTPIGMDPLNCGACHVVCREEAECLEGQCACPEPDRTCYDIKIDFLWIIDNSESMCEEQDNLIRNFRVIEQGMTWLQSSFRMAVVTTDMSDPDHSGRFQNSPVSIAPGSCITPPDTSDCVNNLPLYMESQEYLQNPSVPESGYNLELRRDFRCLASVGIRGVEYEEGLAAAKEALSPETLLLYNDNFLRNDAYLVLIFLSDDNDCSNENTLNRDDSQECEWDRDLLTPVDEFVTFFKELKRDPRQVLVASIVARDDGQRFPEPLSVVETCSTRQGYAYRGYRYLDFIEQFGDKGIWIDVCEEEYAGGLDDLVNMIVETTVPPGI